MISVSDEVALRQYLVARGVASPGEAIEIRHLSGGVSCEVARVTTPRTELVIKQALPKLRVKEDWFSDLRRIITEKDCLAVYQRVVPRSVPELRFADEENFLFAMEAAPPEAEMWKKQLLDGKVDFGVGETVAAVLATIHNATSRNSGVRARFLDVELFVQLRIEPYWRKVAERHPDLAADIAAEIDRNLSTKLALVHGDYSPKNILVSRDRIYLIDFECAHFGDPAFDIAFVTNHLMLKAVKNKPWAKAYLDLMVEMAHRYFAAVDFTEAKTLEEHAVRSLAFLLLARIDGKSPAEYITDDLDKHLVRKVSYRMVRERLRTYHEVREALSSAIAVAGG